MKTNKKCNKIRVIQSKLISISQRQMLWKKKALTTMTRMIKKKVPKL